MALSSLSRVSSREQGQGWGWGAVSRGQGRLGCGRDGRRREQDNGGDADNDDSDEDIDWPSILLEPQKLNEGEVDMNAEADQLFEKWMEFTPQFGDYLIEDPEPLLLLYFCRTKQLVGFRSERSRQSLIQRSIFAPMVWWNTP